MLANPSITGKLISNVEKRQHWISLIHSLQAASQTPGGPLNGWLFHGTDGAAANLISQQGLKTSYAIIQDDSGYWLESKGVHFGSANVAAFFAEDRIESLEDPDIDLVIFGVKITDLEKCGDFFIDGQMLDVPLYSRMNVSEDCAHHLWESSKKDWRAFLDIFETLIVSSDIPAELCHKLSSQSDVLQLCQSISPMMPLQLPAIQLPTVFHIGSLNVIDRGNQGESLEGHLLSVSTCPHSWEKIARLGGNRLNSLSKENALFLDIYAARDNAPIRSIIETWAINQGFLEERTLWKAWNFNFEIDDWTFMLLKSKEEAENECDEENDNGPDGNGCVEPVTMLVGTDSLCKRVCIKDLSTTDSFDYAALIWAEQTQPQFDGVWWLENWDPDSLSAPRGGIFPHRLKEFAIKRCV